MTIDALGYIGINSENLDEWADFGTRLLGFEIAERTRDLIKFRMDDRKQRFIIRRAPHDTGISGWELADSAAVSELGARLESEGITHQLLRADELAERGITEGIWFTDPNGTRLEAYHGAEVAGTPFNPARTISGFRTGELGCGHIVYQTPHVEELREFYAKVLGFRLSDFFHEPFSASFYHVNQRHHSLAFAQAPKPGIHHVMVELNQLDDVGQGYDIARQIPDLVATSFGRHINDLMISYYVKSPDGFFMEYGWGGRSIDVDAWEPFELTYGPSMWGHDRYWLGEEAFAASVALRAKCADEGVSQPVQVAEGNYQVGPGKPAWYEKSVEPLI